MSHIYQPVMLMTLLRNNGECAETEIAKSILTHDQSQIEYYEKITRDIVGKVLRKRDIVSRDGKTYQLNDYEKLSPEEIDQLINVCEEKLESYLVKRGRSIFQHRKKSAGYISGTLKYEVLKRAQFHCELCGISADKKALEVDHIVPRNKGGSDDPSNLQALCYSCNAMKRDRDDTDFRNIRASYEHKEEGCIFCFSTSREIISENELAYARYDKFPVTDLHALIIPKRHISSYFDLSRPELNACDNLLREMKRKIEQADKSVEGFNIGINNGESAGQTIFHCHIHLIPRRRGDVENPRGGVRNVVAGKGNY